MGAFEFGESSEIMAGDTNFDGIVDILDIVRIVYQIMWYSEFYYDEFSAADFNQDGIVDNPTAFDDIVASSVNPSTKYIFQKKYTSNNIEEWRYINATTELIFVKQNNSSIGAYSTYTDDSIIYLIDDDAFKIVNGTNNTLTDTTNYKVHLGRDKLKYQYVHLSLIHI